jgi:hypothetical protein
LLHVSGYAEDYVLGDSLKTIGAGIRIDSLVNRVDLGLWPENLVSVYKKDEKTMVLFSDNYYPFGIIKRESDGKNIFIIDTNGDSILDKTIENLYVPYWVVSLNSPQKKDGSGLKLLLDKANKSFQGNESPEESKSTKEIVEEIISAAKNTNYPDRDLIFLYYQNDLLFSQEDYLQCFDTLEIFDKIYNKRNTSGSHVTIMILLMEALYYQKNTDGAKYICEMINTQYPDCIPGKVYKVLLEEDAEKREKLKQMLKREYPNHWMVVNKL